MKVRDIMRPVFTTELKSLVSDVITLMSKNHSHSVVVVGNGKIVGIITEDDVFDNLDCLDDKVVDIMIKEVKTIDDNEELSEAAETMNREGIKKLPVLKGEKLVGMITATDLISHAGELSEVFIKTMSEASGERERKVKKVLSLDGKSGERIANLVHKIANL